MLALGYQLVTTGVLQPKHGWPGFNNRALHEATLEEYSEVIDDTQAA